MSVIPVKLFLFLGSVDQYWNKTLGGKNKGENNEERNRIIQTYSCRYTCSNITIMIIVIIIIIKVVIISCDRYRIERRWPEDENKTKTGINQNGWIG